MNRLVKTGRWTISLDEAGNVSNIEYGRDFLALLGYVSADEMPKSVEEWKKVVHTDDKYDIINGLRPAEDGKFHLWHQV